MTGPRTLPATIPAMHSILARRPDLAACFPLAASFADWARWSA